ncbi:MAG: alpha/beta fold hydrolase, partial [Nitrospiraceae bacterium]
MSGPHSFELSAADGKMIRGDRTEGKDRQILFITGFLSKRWGNKSKALAQWCEEKDWGFCCYDVRGFGDSDGQFTDYTLSDWIGDARAVLGLIKNGPPITIVGNSLGGWIAWLMAQEYPAVEKLVLIAPAFNMMGVRAKQIQAARRQAWKTNGWMPWDDEPAHKDWPLSWKWVEESEAYWKISYDRLRPVKTTLLHGLQDTVILPSGSREFVEQLLARDPSFPVEP